MNPSFASSVCLQYEHALCGPSETLCSCGISAQGFKDTVPLVVIWKMLSASQTQGPGSPRSSPSHSISRPIPTPIHSDSAVTTPTHTPQDSLMGVGGDVQEAFAQGITAAASRHGNCVQKILEVDQIFFFYLCFFLYISKVQEGIWEMTSSSLLTPSPAQCRLWWKSSTQVMMQH